MNNQGFREYDHVAFKHSRARWKANLYWYVNVAREKKAYEINNDDILKMRAGERQQFETFVIYRTELSSLMCG